MRLHVKLLWPLIFIINAKLILALPGENTVHIKSNCRRGSVHRIVLLMWQREAAGALTSSSVRDVTYGAESGIVDCGCSDRMSPVSDVTTGTAAGAEFQLREVEEQLDNIFTPTPIELLKVTPELIRVLRYVTLHHRGDRVRLCLCACVCVYLCLPASISPELRVRSSTNFYPRDATQNLTKIERAVLETQRTVQCYAARHYGCQRGTMLLCGVCPSVRVHHKPGIVSKRMDGSR